MKFVVFEDSSVDNFYPLSQTRPLWELRSGAFTFRQRMEKFIEKFFKGNNEIYFFTRDYLVPYFSEKYPDISINDYSVFNKDEELFFINSTLYPDDVLLKLEPNSSLYSGDKPAALRARVSEIGEINNDIGNIIKNFDNLKKITSDAADLGINYIWDLMQVNGELIIKDYEKYFEKKKIKIPDGVTITGDSNLVYIDRDVKIEPYVHLDVSKGPIIIESGTEVHSFTRIEGPSFVGKDCIILGAKLRRGVSIGDFCRIGGEVEESIFHGYSNKYHDGFIGHSYVGEWVNMGAMTTNSDLKNNYSDIKVYLPSGRVNTMRNKVGCFIGDFTKTSIGTLINTGSSIGTGSMLVHNGGLTPAHIPPFAWYYNSSISRINWLDDFLSTCEKVTERRGVIFTENYSNMLKFLYSSREGQKV